MFVRSSVLVSCLAVSVGCVADVGTDDPATADESVAETTSALTDTNQVWPLAWHGGTARCGS